MEADSLRWWLLIIGSLVIVGLAVHGIWLSRKNSEKKAKANKHKKDQEYQPSGWQSENESFDEVVSDANQGSIKNSEIKLDIESDEADTNLAASLSIKDNYDDLGLSSARVVSSNLDIDDETDTGIDAEQEQIPTTDIQTEPEVSTSKIYASVVTQPKPEYTSKYSSLAAETVAISQQERATTNRIAGSTNSPFNSNDNYQAPEPPPFLLKKEVSEPENNSDTNKAAEQSIKNFDLPEQKDLENTSANSTEKLSLSEQARNLVKSKKTDSIRKRREPKIADDQMRIDFDDQPAVEPELKEQLKSEPTQSDQPQEVLVLNVKSADDNPIPGAALLPMLLTLGFKFGDQDIFHRHVNSNGKGPVLFSLANMFKPGNFDIDNLENFTTQGISLFMILPIEGEPHQVFNMMHNAARKIADEFSAKIYDGRRTLLTKQSLQQYVEKIREFERKRLLKG